SNMNLLKLILLSILIFSCSKPVLAPSKTVSTYKDRCSYEVRFSPNGGATENIVSHIKNTRTSLYATTYSFTSQPITDAIIKLTSHKNHREIGMVLDRSNLTVKGGRLQDLLDAGIAVYIDSAHSIQHNKVIIIDRRWVITGSFNFSAAAESRNAENSIILDCPNLAEMYIENFEEH